MQGYSNWSVPKGEQAQHCSNSPMCVVLLKEHFQGANDMDVSRPEKKLAHASTNTLSFW
jgi:hypothetical protein